MSNAFWEDLKATATKPYNAKSKLHKAYGACVLMFAIAVFPMPYAYYAILRTVVCVSLFFFARAAYRLRPAKVQWLAITVGLMVLYNPLIPVQIGVHLVWTLINIATLYVLYRARLALEPVGDEPKK